jgi:hypothetical protein
MTPITVKCDIHLERHGKAKSIQPGRSPVAVESGRVPRITRFLALAIQAEQLLRDGTITSYSELAELGHVTRARITQIMNLLHLAPDIQESILDLPRTTTGRDPIILRDLQLIAMTLDWKKQRKLWRELFRVADTYL